STSSNVACAPSKSNRLLFWIASARKLEQLQTYFANSVRKVGTCVRNSSPSGFPSYIGRSRSSKFGSNKSHTRKPRLAALSSYVGPIPLKVVPIFIVFSDSLSRQR